MGFCEAEACRVQASINGVRSTARFVKVSNAGSIFTQAALLSVQMFPIGSAQSMLSIRPHHRASPNSGALVLEQSPLRPLKRGPLFFAGGEVLLPGIDDDPWAMSVSTEDSG